MKQFGKARRECNTLVALPKTCRKALQGDTDYTQREAIRYVLENQKPYHSIRLRHKDT